MISKKVKVLAIQFIIFCFLSLFITLSQAEVTLTIGKGSGDPSATESQVAVSLENQSDLVKGVQVDICDEVDYLSCTTCETTDRTSDFICSVNEGDDGCCRVILAKFGGVIETGQGSIFIINYDVSSGAPSGCRDLNQENVSVADENNQPLAVTSVSGGFCFPCTADPDCDDGLFCNDNETCVDGACQPGTDQCTSGQVCDERGDICIAACVDDLDCTDTNSCTVDSCDLDSGYCQNDPLPDGTACEDGVYCNGIEACDAGGICQPGTDPCPGQLCDETLYCVDCFNDVDCEDASFCNGVETCDANGDCQPGTDPCTPQLCDEGDDICVECMDDVDCNDGLYCNGEETCSLEGNCQPGTNSCPGQECDETLHCVDCLNDTDCDDPTPLCNGSTHTCVECLTNADCEDASFCNGVETCDASNVCQPGTDPCPPQLVCNEDDDVCNCSQDDYCDDGLFCNGGESCLSGVCQAGSDPCPGQSCNESTDSCETITSTTTSTNPPPPPPPTTSTTTTAMPHSYKVTISPSSATFDSGATGQFSARTTDGGEDVGGIYDWEIYPARAIGSEIDEEGLFTAGDNTTDSAIEETVKVTDTAHENKSATATVTIKVKEEPPPECEVVINPSSATVSSRSTLALRADTTGDSCKTGDYEWSIESEIGSVIDQEGNYGAGINNTGSQTTDVITVVDHANANISGSASIMIESKIASVFPNTLLGSRWIPLPYFLLILGEDTKLKPSSTITFEPDDDILKIAQLKLFNSFLVIVLVNADPQEGTVAVTISSGEEVLTGEVSIKLISLPFVEDYSSSAESYSEISLDAATLPD